MTNQTYFLKLEVAQNNIDLPQCVARVDNVIRKSMRQSPTIAEKPLVLNKFSFQYFTLAATVSN